MPLIGREARLEQLRGLLRRAGGGEPAVAFVTGESGSGKTALIEAALRAWNGRVLSGRSFPGGTAPFKPWLDGIRRLDHEARQTAGPGWQRLLSGGEPASDQDLLETLVTGLLSLVGSTPTVLVLEDLHFADAASLELLVRLADRLRGERLLVVGSYRPEEVARDHPLRRVRSRLRSIFPYQEIALAPLDPASTLALMEHRLGGPVHLQLAQRLHDGSHGNPLYLGEYCDALLREGSLTQGRQGWELRRSGDLPVPESIRDAFAHRLDALSPPARRLLEAAAVLGPEFDLHLLFTLADDRNGLDALVEHGWLEAAVDGPGRFKQSLAREAILCEMTWSRRSHLHGRLADLLTSQGAPAAEIAPHYLACGDRVRARAAFLAAADAACRVHAYEDAFLLFHRALDLWPPEPRDPLRAEALQRLAACAQTSGRLEEAARAWRELLDAPTRPGDALARGQAFHALATVLELQGRFRPAIQAHIDAAHALEQADRPADASAAWFAAGQLLMCQALHKRSAEAFQRAADLARTAGDVVLESSALGEGAVSAAMLGKAEEALGFIDQSLSLAMAHNLTDSAAEAYRRRAIIYDYLSDLPKEKAAFDDALRFCRMNGVKAQEKLCLACMAYGLFRMGDWSESLGMCREINDDPELDPLSKAVAQMTRGLIHAHRGEYRQGHDCLVDNSEAARSLGYVAGEFFSLWGLAIIAEAEQRTPRADSHYRQLLDLWPDTDDRHDVLDPLCAAAAFFAAQDLPAETQRCCRIAGQIAAETGNAEATAALAWCLGERAASQDQFSEAMEHHHQALAGYERLSLPVQVVSASERLLACAYALDDLPAAATHGRKALGIARRLGLRPAIRRINALLSRCDVEVGRDVPASFDHALLGQLTPRQREVADELAQGRTNKEIAARLHLSVRTVDMHVRHILDRLHCRSRTEAIRILLEAEA